jgi:hypothetical protein
MHGLFPPAAPNRRGSPSALFPLYQPLRGRFVKSAERLTAATHQRSNVTSLNQQTPMKYVGYIERFETELERLLKGPSEAEAIVKWASDKVFESYRNGVEVGKNARHAGKPRRKEAQTQAEAE